MLNTINYYVNRSIQFFNNFHTIIYNNNPFIINQIKCLSDCVYVEIEYIFIKSITNCILWIGNIGGMFHFNILCDIDETKI